MALAIYFSFSNAVIWNFIIIFKQQIIYNNPIKKINSFVLPDFT